MSQPLASAYHTNRVLDKFGIMHTPSQMTVLKPIFIFSGLTFQHFMHFLFHKMWTFYPAQSLMKWATMCSMHASLSRFIICGNHIMQLCMHKSVCRYDFHNPMSVASFTLLWITKPKLEKTLSRKVCLPKP